MSEQKGATPSVVPIFIPMANRGIRPKQITYAKIGKANNNSRLWLEGLRLNDVGFTRGTPFRFTSIPELSTVLLDKCPESQKTNTVSGKKRANLDEYKPVIDINNKDLTSVLGDFDTVRVMYYANRLLVQAHTNELNARTAIEDLEINTKARKLTMGVIGVGGGVFSAAIKEGLKDTNIDLETSWMIDIENKYLQNNIDNTQNVSDNTIIVEGDASDVEVNLLTPVNIFMISNACTGLSPAGKAKNQLEHAEEHKKSGLMVLKTLEIIEKYMPPVIWHENVIQFESSASAALFAGKLKQLGYNIQWGRYGGEMGTLEERKRSIICATHKSLNFDMAHHLLPVMEKEQKLKDVMDNVPLDSDTWKPYTYLVEKAVRDKEAGKGFMPQHFTGDEPAISVLRAGIHKVGSTDPLFIHPENPKLFRLPTVGEHARFMKIPESIVANQSATVAHEILGQSGSYALVKAMGVMTGKELNAQYNDEILVLDQSMMALGDLELAEYEFDSGDEETLRSRISQESFAAGSHDDDYEEQEEPAPTKNQSMSLF